MGIGVIDICLCEQERERERERESERERERCGVVSYSESLGLREIKVLQVLALTCTRRNKFTQD